MFYSHLVYLTVIWYILCSFGTYIYGILVYFMVFISPFLVCCTKKNMATLLSRTRRPLAFKTKSPKIKPNTYFYLQQTFTVGKSM
jgi:hypothetical protein